MEAKTPLKRFHVKCKDVVDQYWVLEWIPKVLKRGVLDIDLHIPSSRGFCENSSFYPLPSKIFESKTLVRLKIQFQDGVSIHVKRGVSLPKLKTLHLDYFRIDTSTFNKLLSACHALEELVLVNMMWGDSLEHEACPVTVSIPTLKRLKLCRSEDFYEAEFHEYEDYDEENINAGVSLSFDNPNLVYFEYSDAIVDRFKQVRFDSLVEANLRLRKTTDDQTKTDKINVTKLLMGIRNVKILYLSNDTLEGLHHKYTDRCGDKDGCLCKYENHWGAKLDVHTCLSSSPEQIEHVKHFLETMPDLEQVILYYNTPKDEDVMKVFKKLEKLPGVASANCNVQIKAKNLSLSSTSTKRGTLL
ncbi:predicted protein [Arabidopsis lyrata subsp. lyrata]|uniref:Predicted protein n=1 Tax=Arabidopsis lyrata subsp. lyrata TaxID=81972 RepID=D7MIQ9_ARALL|nr:predicted protein [Arabidopsis lyrata subsp. lyrata]